MIKWLKNSRLYDVGQRLVISVLGKREKLAKVYIRGKGLEIGALNYPLGVASGKAEVTYMDRMDNSSLRRHYPELDFRQFVHIGIIDDGERLKKVKDNSQDFVIANHFIEHCENPLMTLVNSLRVLKGGGVIFWAVPNKNRTFDKQRKLTTLGHLWRDYKIGPARSRERHYGEWAKYVLGLSPGEARERAVKLMREKYSIHFHVWTRESFKAFLIFARKKLKLKFKIEELVTNLNEFIVIIRKNG